MKIFLLLILILSALTNLCSRGRSPSFVRSRYCICYSRNLGGGGRYIIELYFKFRGQCPPALPVADPMVACILYSTNVTRPLTSLSHLPILQSIPSQIFQILFQKIFTLFTIFQNFHIFILFKNFLI